MIKNYIKIALRNIVKRKVYSTINIFGLAVGLAACIMILLFIRDELSYDRYHKNADNIYRVLVETPGPLTPVMSAVPTTLGDKLKERFPEIQDLVRLENYYNVTVSIGEEHIVEPDFFLSDPSFFDIFSLRLLQGDPKTALIEPYSVVLSESIAEKYYGDISPLQQQIKVDGKGTFTVTGVMQDMPLQSHFHLDFLGSLSSIGKIKNSYDHWSYTYLLLPEKVSLSDLQDKLNVLAKDAEYLGWGRRDMKFRLQPLLDIHLHSNFAQEIEANSDIRYIYIFSALAGLILLIACFNYMNLATACSTHRAREVGIRKVIGSTRSHLTLQFLGESIIFSLFSVVAALLLVELLLPTFNNLVQKQLSLNVFSDGWLLAGCLGLAVCTGLLAGSYPAFFLSSFLPIRVLKGIMNDGRGAARFRTGLVLVQFGAAICLIAVTIVMQEQLDFMRNKKLGFEKENVIELPILGTSIKEKTGIFKAELLQHPSILNVSAASGAPIDGPGVITTLKDTRLQIMMIDENYIPTLGMELIEGRNFSKTFATDSSAFLVNEKAVALMEWEEPLGQEFGGFRREGTVVGVVKDFHNRSLHEPIEPMAFQIYPRYFNRILLKVDMNNFPETLGFLEEKWQQFEKVRPFGFSFLDQNMDKLYRSEQRMSSFFRYFSGLAILIACLGLFGLVSFSTEQRTKEIGVRKVLGATLSNITLLLSKDFIKLVLFANLIAWPIAWFAMDSWLQDFAYRVDVGWMVFVISGAVALIVALITVSVHAIRAARVNPVESLRYE